MKQLCPGVAASRSKCRDTKLKSYLLNGVVSTFVSADLVCVFVCVFLPPM